MFCQEILDQSYITSNIMNMKLNILVVSLLFPFCLTGQVLPTGATLKAEDILSPASAGSVVISGMLGQKLDSCIKNGVMLKDYDLFTKAYREKLDDDGGFRGELWGKWVTAACLAYRYQPTTEHKNALMKAVKSLIATQGADGRISSNTADFGTWDIWARKYVLLGLIAFYDQTGDKKALDAASRSLDYIIGIAGPGKTNLTETGLKVLEGLSQSSILEPIVLVYERTGQAKYLTFAKYLVSLWSTPNKYTNTGIRLVEDALAGVDPIKISMAKGYDMMSCFEGICELYRVTGDKTFLNAVVKFSQSLRKKEIMIVGSGSSEELWCDGVIRQTQLVECPMENCVTVTWIKLCYQLLRLTGDPVWADEMEVSLYNALMGAIVADGHWWAYYSALAGERIPSPLQVPDCKTSCCVSSGPRGLLTIPGWSVMNSAEGPVVNLYTPGSWNQKLADGNDLMIIQKTNYPVDDRVEIEILQKKPARYTIKLRIPGWSLNTRITVNREPVQCKPGTYVSISREWTNEDKISLTFDFRGRVISAPGNLNYLAIMRGPVVLALDNRFVKAENINLWLQPDNITWKHDDELKADYVVMEPAILQTDSIRYIDLKPVLPVPEGAWMAFEVPFVYKPIHFFYHKKQTLIMCDYASAGNQYSETNLFRVWMPQPLYMNDVFPANTWNILYFGIDKRPDYFGK
jgi:uncharacterized protein